MLNYVYVCNVVHGFSYKLMFSFIMNLEDTEEKQEQNFQKKKTNSWFGRC